MTVLILISIGVQKSFGLWYFLGVALGATLFIYLQHLIRYRRRELCFQAFLNNHYFGLLVFIGLVLKPGQARLLKYLRLRGPTVTQMSYSIVVMKVPLRNGND